MPVVFLAETFTEGFGLAEVETIPAKFLRISDTTVINPGGINSDRNPDNDP